MRKKILILVLVLPLSACSAFGFLFERLPWLTRWQLDSMFDLNSEQEALVEKGSLAMQIWLREEGFPRLIESLVETRQAWSQYERREAIAVFDAAIQVAISDFLVAVTPHVQAFLLSLDADNASHYRAYNEEKTRDWFEYAESEEAKREKRIEKMEDWFGSLNTNQELIISEHIHLIEGERDIRVRNNAVWSERMLRAALNRDARALNQWIQEPSSWWTEEFTALRAANRQQVDNALSALLPTLDEDQHAHADEEVADWLDKLRGVL